MVLRLAPALFTTALLAMAPAPLARGDAATITIDASRPARPMSPLLYGQFLEFMFEGVKGGLHAELLRDRGFEEAPNALGLPRDWECYPDDRNDDYGLSFAWDAETAYTPDPEFADAHNHHALRVVARDGVLPRHGVYQPRVPVRAGIEYRGSVWLKTSDYTGRILVALEPDSDADPPYAEATLEGIAGDWKQYEFRLTPRRGDALARFALLFYGRGQVWVDQVSLMPGDAVGVVRRDVFDRVQALRPAFLRWPGGNVAQDYHWRWGIGPRDRRPTWINLSWKNEPEPSDFGTDEYLDFCRRLGAEPTITVNVEGRGATVEEAAAWVEYCNGPVTSAQGAIRARNGHPQPYRVGLWEVGNEIWGEWVRGHSDAETYARNYLRYAAAMRAVDSTIRLIAVGDNDMNWNRTVLRRAGEAIDDLAIHHYYSRRDMRGDPLNLMAHPLAYERFYQEFARTVRELVPNHRIALAINEWGLDLPVEQQYSMDAALYAARMLNVFERANDLVAMSAVSDLVNGWPGGIIQASRHGVFVTPIYLVNQLYREHQGVERVAVEVVGPTFDSSREGKGIPYLDVVATRSADGQEVVLKVVNTDRARPIRVSIQVRGFSPAARGKVARIRARSPGATLGFLTPDAIAVERVEFEAGPKFEIELPAASISAIRMKRELAADERG
jgi:alpha-N-arabinofuranosidase